MIMLERFKIISNTDPGAVVNQVNNLLLDGWKILSEHCFATHAVTSNVLLVPCFVIYLVKEDS